jgi:hypothetical protein
MRQFAESCSLEGMFHPARRPVLFRLRFRRLRLSGYSRAPLLSPVAADLPWQLFAELDRQLEAKGLFVKSGTLIDTSLIESRCQTARSRSGIPMPASPGVGNGASSATRRIWPSIRGRI